MGKSIGELVLLARQDDQNAINELYNQTFKKAYFVARTAIKSSDGDYSSQIEDILQDAYVKAFSSLDKLEDPEKFQGWLDTIVINRCKDFLKKKKPTLFSDMASENSDDGSILDFEDSRENDRMEFKPEETVDYGETKRLIAEMLDRMPEDQKMCLLMYYYEEMSVRQIAEAMDCSEGTIKSRLNYARKNLKGQVLELEKKGTKLYCMPLLPFLYWFFREKAAEFIGGTAGTVAAGAAAQAAASAGQSISTASASASVNAGQTAAAGRAVSSGAAQTTATGQTISGGAASGTAGSTGAGASAASGAAGSGAAASSSTAGAAGAVAKTAAAAAGKASLGVGAKLAMVGAAVVIGGGGAAVASGKVPVDLPWEQAIDVSKFELDENGLLPNEVYDNKKNQKAVKAYQKALEELDNGYVHMVDLDQDGVVELVVTDVYGEADANIAVYYMDYEKDKQLNQIYEGLTDEIIDGLMVAFNPVQHQLVLTTTSYEINGVKGETFTLTDHVLEKADDFAWAPNEDPEHQQLTTSQLKQAEDIFKDTEYLNLSAVIGDEISEEAILYPSEAGELTRNESDWMTINLNGYDEWARPFIISIDTKHLREGERTKYANTTLLSYADYRNDENKEAVAAYLDALKTKPEFRNLRTMYPVDVNQDGVVELIVVTYDPPEDYIWEMATTRMLTYDGTLGITEIDSNLTRYPIAAASVIPEEKKLVMVDTVGYRYNGQEYTVDGNKVTEQSYYSHEPLYSYDNLSPEGKEDDAKSVEEMNKAVLVQESTINSWEEFVDNMHIWPDIFLYPAAAKGYVSDGITNFDNGIYSEIDY